ncbi:MAG: hypothetical protein ACI8PB_000031 [Desulforhopalus sp.]|jgi:hypothetical protein
MYFTHIKAGLQPTPLNAVTERSIMWTMGILSLQICKTLRHYGHYDTRI